MTTPRARRAASSVADHHHQAVMNTLSWADDAAAAGDYADALSWLHVITAIGDELPSPYPARRAFWQAAMRTAGARRNATSRAGADESTDRFQNCPRCGLSIKTRHRSLEIRHCPRCVARAGMLVRLFSSQLATHELYHPRSIPVVP